MVRDVAAFSSPLLSHRTLIDLWISDSKEIIQQKSVFNHTMFIHDALVVVHCWADYTLTSDSCLLATEAESYGEQGERLRQRSGTPSASILCLPRPYPYGSSLSMRLGTTCDSTVITNEDTLFVLFSLFMCMCVSFLLQNVVCVDIFNSSLCMDFQRAAWV